MNKISIYFLALLVSLSSTTIYSQGNNKQVTSTNEQDKNIFYHTIESGQTVYAIATMYNVSIDDIFRLNPESKDGIKVGFKLKIPQNKSNKKTNKEDSVAYEFHTIQAKETLYSLSIKYNIPATSIIEANPGLSVSTFQTGKTIRIPQLQTTERRTEESKSTKKEIEYQIEKRETIYGICRKFNITNAELVKRNPQLKDGARAGMIIKIPVYDDNGSEQKIPQPKEKDINDLLSATKEIKQVNKIKIALLLPFMTEEATPSASTTRFIEYYEGILLAIDSLRNSGYSVDLTVRDTGNGTKTVNEILKEDGIKNANLIIGAVQNDQISMISSFAQKNNIKYVIPFTSKNDDVLSNAYIFQVNTPHSYLYAKASQAGCNLFQNYNIIFVDTNEKDDKSDFLKTFKSDLKQKNIVYKELTYKTTSFPEDIESLLSKDKRNVIVPTSGSLETLNKIKSPLRLIAETKFEYGISLFGYPEWQTYTRECLDDFFALNTYIYSNFYADNTNNNVSGFYTKYKNWFNKNISNTFPKYSILGFDTGMFFFTALNKYGTNFENNLNKIKYQSIQSGFNFERVNNWGGFINTNIFIVHYDKENYTITRSDIK